MTNSLFFLPFIIVPLCIITTAILITYNNIRQVKEQSDSRKQAEQERQLETLDAQAEARRWLERLGSEVLTTDGIDPDSKNLIATATERYTTAQTTLDAAPNPQAGGDRPRYRRLKDSTSCVTPAS